MGDLGELSFRVLGPVQVLRGAEVVPVAGGTVSSLLAGLLVSANQIVAPADLITTVWGEEGPANPDAALQGAVFRLRRLLGETAIETTAGGYRMPAVPESLDLLEFRRLTAAARAESTHDAGYAAALLDQAVSLWRLPVLSNVSSVSLRRDVAPRLTDEFLDAHEQRARLYLRLGRHRSIAGDLRDLAARFPYREQLAAALMVSLYRCGRQTDALAAYERLRHVLAEDLGIDPTPELRDLHTQILRADLPVLEGQDDAPLTSVAGKLGSVTTPAAVTASVPRQLPPDIADFTGRAAELALLQELFAATRDQPSGGPAICVVTGPGGIGKTALAVRAARMVSAAYPDGQLYADLQGVGGRPVEPGEILSQFLRALGTRGRQLPPGLEERAAMFRSLTANRRMLLLLDNAAGEGQLRRLLPGSGNCAVLITSRNQITGLPGDRLVRLGVLGEAEAIDLLSRMVGPGRVSAEHADARVLAGLTGGLPLALRIVGARLAARPHWRLSTMADRLADRRRRLGELRHGDLDVRASLGLSYLGLPLLARALLRRITLLDVGSLPAWAAAALLDCSLGDARELMDRLVDAHLLEAENDAPERIRYRCHDLVRDYAHDLALTEDPAADRKAALARLFGALLALTGHAHRQIYGGDYTILHGGARRWLAADMSPSRVVGSEPLAWLEGERLLILAAVRQGAELDLDEFCWEQTWTALTLFQARGYLDDWQTAQQLALAAAVRAGNRRGEAAMLAALGSLVIYQQDYDGACPLYESAARIFAEIGDRHGYAIAQQRLGLADTVNGQPERALRRLEESRAAVREAGDRFTEMAVVLEMARIHIERENFTLASDALGEAAQISRAIGTAYARAFTLHMHGLLYLRQGQLIQAERAFSRALRAAEEVGERIGQLHARLGLAEALLGLERHRLAEAQLDEVIDAATRLHQPSLHARALLVLGRLRADHGDYDAAMRLLNASVEIFGRRQIPLWQARALDAVEDIRRRASHGHGCPVEQADPVLDAATDMRDWPAP